MQATQHNTPSAPNGQQPNSDSPPLVPVLYDLLISSRKNGYGTTSHADSPILWWKMAGQPKEKPPQPVTLIHPLIQKRLQAYVLIDTEVQINQIIRKYRKVEVQNV
jgi:hypothetical protein